MCEVIWYKKITFGFIFSQSQFSYSYCLFCVSASRKNKGKYVMTENGLLNFFIVLTKSKLIPTNRELIFTHFYPKIGDILFTISRCKTNSAAWKWRFPMKQSRQVDEKLPLRLDLRSRHHRNVCVQHFVRTHFHCKTLVGWIVYASTSRPLVQTQDMSSPISTSTSDRRLVSNTRSAGDEEDTTLQK